MARGLTCRFGEFHSGGSCDFTIERGDIFGFVGSNGCGKTTTMKMLTGLLPATEGEALLFGKPLDASDLALRRRVGYMSQSFSLYSELTVRQNLELHTQLFHFPPAEAKAQPCRVDRPLWPRTAHRPDRAGPAARDPAAAVARRSYRASARDPHPRRANVGVDPLARDRFWEMLIHLSRNEGVTIFVSTHFMNEAQRCDRLSLMDSGHVLATDTPAGLIASRGAATLEEAFILYLEEATGAPAADTTPAAFAAAPDTMPLISNGHSLGLRRLVACTIRETLELVRDPIRLGFAVFGTSFLMLVFGFGVSTDVNSLTFAVLDHDHSHESRGYLEELRGSAYFVEKPPITDYEELELRLSGGSIDCAIEIPPGFGRDIAARPPCLGRLPGSTVRGHSSHRQFADICRPCTSSTSAIALWRRRLSRPLPKPISRCGSGTTRISRASTRWSRRPCRWSLRCFRRS